MKLVRAQNQEYEEVDKTIHTEDVRNIRQVCCCCRRVCLYLTHVVWLLLRLSGDQAVPTNDALLPEQSRTQEV